MSSASAGRGAGAPPHPPGRGKRGPGPGRGEHSEKSKKARTAKSRGRPLQAMERMTIMNIWYQLSIDARRSLVDALGGMLGDQRPAVVPSGTNASNPDESQNASSRHRVWERPILRDVPLFQDYGQLTTRERRDDNRNVPQRISIATGVVARGQAAGITDREITEAIVANIDDIAALKGLYVTPTGENASSGAGVAAPPLGDADQDVLMNESTTKPT